MQVFKFGGASVKDSNGIKRVAKIIKAHTDQRLVVVVSAMGKTTNALEYVWSFILSNAIEDAKNQSVSIFKEHSDVLKQLQITTEAAWEEFRQIQDEFFSLMDHGSGDKDVFYDLIVSFGERLSSLILCEYLKLFGISVVCKDARQLIVTNDMAREARVDWAATESAVRNTFQGLNDDQVLITQGFVGATIEGVTTTLGREGSDFSAAILAYCLDAESMHIWKDVPGVLTGDPRLFDNVAKIDRMSYLEAIEMTYYGAKVIHPKTIKPLQNKNIPLYVRSFIEPESSGTLISGEMELNYPPVVVIEPAQVLLHISSKDFSFMAEDHLKEVFDLLTRFRIKVNMMRNTAISFTICINQLEDRIQKFKTAAEEKYKVIEDKGLELITVRHYTPEILAQMKKGKIVLFEERLAGTIQIVVKEIPLMERKK